MLPKLLNAGPLFMTPVELSLKAGALTALPIVDADLMLDGVVIRDDVVDGA